MLLICNIFFSVLGIKISTDPNPALSKTKVLIFGNIDTVPLRLYNRDIPNVTQAKHLGHIINTDESMKHDLNLKTNEMRAGYFTLLQELGDQNPFVFLRLLKIYILHLYGCPLWDIFDESSITLWTAWHRMVKQIFNLPLATHRYIVNAVSAVDHIQLTVIKRFLKFHDKLKISNNLLIQNLFSSQVRDNRSIFGRNCCKIKGMVHQRALNYNIYRDINIHQLPDHEEWRVPVVFDVLESIRQCRGANVNSILNLNELQMILSSVCCD